MTTALDRRFRTAVQPRVRYFYTTMAASCVAVAFLTGFAPTYWLPMAAGTFKANPIVHIHGLVFFAWTLFVLLQTWLVASGRTARHRTVGLIGVSLATAMTMLGILVAINLMKGAATIGQADAGRAFAIVPILSILFFAATVAIAIAKVQRPETHKRLMLLATISILDAPIARWFMTFLAPPGAVGPPPVEVDLGPSMVSWLLLIVAIVHDWRRHGRPHAVYLLGGAVLVVLKFTQTPLSTTTACKAAAGWLVGLAG